MRRFPYTLAPALVAALALATGPGCRPGAGTASDDHDHDHEQGHDHEPKTAQISVWTESHEIFVEHQPPVAGKATTFVTHVTDLRTSEPRREGPVTCVLRQGDSVTEHPQGQPARPGIYLPGLIFPKPGDWNVSVRIPADGTNAVVDLGTIRVHDDAHDAQHAEVGEAPDGVNFLKEQQWRIGTRCEPVRRRSVRERLRLPAQVRAKPGHRAGIAAPVAGFLLAAPDAPPLKPGQRVEAGQLLALLKPAFSEATARLAEAEAELAAARSGLDQAEATLNRTRRLAAEQAKSPRELHEAELALTAAQARHAAALGLAATFRQGNTARVPGDGLRLELRSPLAGALVSVAAGPGDAVAADQIIFHVLDPETVWIEARVPEVELGRLAKPGDALIEVPGRPGDFVPIPGEGNGGWSVLGWEVDPATRTVPLVYEVPNRELRLRPGQAVDLQVGVASADNVIAIPDGAIVEEGGRPVAFVQLGGETFEKRELVLGARDGTWVQVLSGLAEGERLVTRGAHAIRLASMFSTIPSHGHAH